jgi:hypothetical protein
VLDEHVELLERAIVQQQFDALARRQLAARVLRLDALFTAAKAATARRCFNCSRISCMRLLAPCPVVHLLQDVLAALRAAASQTFGCVRRCGTPQLVARLQLNRHPSEGWGPHIKFFKNGKAWIPAFAGMTTVQDSEPAGSTHPQKPDRRIKVGLRTANEP